MAQKRIERSDLVAPDAILQVVKELETLEDVQKNILEINKELLKSNAFTNPTDVKEYNETVKSINASTKTLNETEKERLRLEKQIKDSTDENVKAKLRLQKANKEQRDVLKDLIVLEDKEAGTLTKLNARNRQLRRERARLNLETSEGRKRLLEINQALDKNNQEIKENSDVLKKQRINVGNYKDSVKEALDETNLWGVSFSQLTDTVTNFAKNPLTAVTAGLGALTALYASSTSGAKDLRSATTRLTTTYGGFAEGLAKLVGADGRGGGLLDSLVKNIKQAVTGLPDIEGDLAVQATNALDELRVTLRESERLAKQQLDRAEELRQIRDDDQRSFAERTKANEDLIELINEREETQLETQREILKNKLILLSLDKENIDLQLEVKDTEFEIADIQEENEGFRSEALTNRNSLQREQNTLLQQELATRKKFNDELKKGELSEEDEGAFDSDLDAAVKAETEALKEKRKLQEEEDKESKAALDKQLADREYALEKELDAEELAAEERKRIREEERDANQRFAEQTLNTISDSLDKLSEKRIQAIEEEEEEVEKNIERQERRAEQGLDNTLAFEQQKAAELEKQREEEQKKQERRQKIQAYLTAFTEYLKQDPDSAAGKALAQVAIAEAISGFFYEGTEFIGEDNATKWRNTGKDDYLIAAHKGERIVDHVNNRKIGNISNDDLADLALSYRNGQLVSVGLDSAPITEGLQRVEKAVERSAQMINLDELGNFIDTRIENGLKQKVRYKRGRI